jgi:hypothetical protein
MVIYTGKQKYYIFLHYFFKSVSVCLQYRSFFIVLYLTGKVLLFHIIYKLRQLDLVSHLVDIHILNNFYSVFLVLMQCIEEAVTMVKKW